MVLQIFFSVTVVQGRYSSTVFSHRIVLRAKYNMVSCRIKYKERRPLIALSYDTAMMMVDHSRELQ